MKALLPIVLLVVAGTFLSVQAPLNAVLARALANGVLAAAVSFGAGFAVLLALALVRTRLPDAAALASVPWWAWTGGVLGAFYVWTALWSVPRVGVLTVAAALVFGQIVAALAIDRLGLFGLPVQPVSWTRLLGASLVGLGLVLTRL